ncbi:hypothetical protein BaRGS_00002319 [Batillaria attramentaria]|uniref:TMC domain-containing protein n=1 Tax=Batillaria attramentaria TaxID=370345 RepID=A0ABD0M3F4_9CAEN
MYTVEGDVEGQEDGDESYSLLDKIHDQKDIMEDVKNQPWPITRKLQVLSLARQFVEKHEGRLSRSQGYQRKGQQLLKQVKRWWNNLVYWMTPWEMRIKRIESHFGSVVTSYFIFLRWLLWINVWLTLMQLCFVIMPEMLVGDSYGTTERKTIPEDEKYTAYDLKTIWDAEGVMRYSLLFYGYYGNAEFIGNGYRLPLAYLLTSLASFAYSFIVVLKKMASNSRQSRMSNKDEQFTFSWKLFTDWDFMVGNSETATTKHASIVTTFKEAIIEEQEKGKQEGNKYLQLFLRILANVIIVMLLAVSTYVIQLFVNNSRELEKKQLEHKGDYDAGFWAENELTIIMTLISTLFPNVLDLISLMEKYHPRTSLRLQLARIFVLNFLNLYTLFIALYNKQKDLEVFKLTIMDLIFMLGQIVLIDVLRSYFVKYCNSICCWDLQKKFPEYPDFKTAENLLHLINNQGVIWLGSFFSPGLSVLNLLKLLLMMYVRCWTVMVCNVPQDRIFRASRSNNFYFALLLVMLFLCMLPPLFAIVGIEPSPSCGPFSGLEKIFHVLTNTMETQLPESINSVLNYAASPGVIVPIFMLLGMTIYYLVSIGRSLRDANNELRMMLEYERTEGRKKVYAMADAKRDLENPDGKSTGKKGDQKFVSAASSVLKANHMARVITAAGAGRKNNTAARPVVGQKVAPPVQPKPYVPVAVVHGKRTLKRSEADAINKVPYYEKRSGPEIPGTNGQITSSIETELSSNDDDEGSISSPSSVHSAYFPDDPAAFVDDTGHLMPVTEDDVLLEIDDNDDHAEENPRSRDFQNVDEEEESGYSETSATAVIPLEMIKQRQHAARPPVRSKPSRKIQPATIPRITVIDCGEDILPEENLNDLHVEPYVEPQVIVENEYAKNLPEGAMISDRKTSSKSKTGKAELHEVRAEESEMVTSNLAPPSALGNRKSFEGIGRSVYPKAAHKANPDNNKIGFKTQDCDPPKERFASVLARFKNMDV